MEDNRLISIDAKLKDDDLLKYLMLAQNSEVKMLFDYLKHQPLSEQDVWHLFDLRREHLVNYLVRKRPSLAYEEFCAEDLDWPVELEQNKHLEKVFHDLLRACFKQSSFCKQQNKQPEWYDDRKPSEIRFALPLFFV